jgi:DNA-binding NarL/FixJ family response regulator
MHILHTQTASATGKILQRRIDVLVAASKTEDRSILSENHAEYFGLALSSALLTDLECKLRTSQPDVLLIDVTGEKNRMALLQLLRKTRKDHPALRCVLLMDAEEIAFQVMAFQSGIRGIVPQTNDADQILGKCICVVHDGEFWIPNEVLEQIQDGFSKESLPLLEPARGSLSPREQQVMDLVVQGFSNRAIAEVLQVTESTVKKYVYEVFNKTGASNRVELVLRALRSSQAA